MKKIILFIVMISYNLLSAQDLQWFVKDFKPIDGINYGSQILNLNSIKLTGIHGDNPGTTPPGRKDFFIIFGDGNCINTRPNYPTCYPILGNELKIISSNGPINYLYVTNIYQGDDPPGFVHAIDGLGNVSLNNINLGQTPEPFSVTHDFVPGEDVTLIIPKSLIDSCIGQLDLTFDRSFFLTSPVFYNSSTGVNQWSYLDLPSTTLLMPTGIANISSPVSPYHFFNFQVINPLPTGKNIGDPMSFTLKCNSTEIRNVTDFIRDVHDPNFIEVKCIYKKPKPKYCFWCKDQYFVKYKIQFMNDGTSPVEDVKVNFTLPSVVKANTLKVGNWSFGDTTGCGRGPCLVYTPSFPNIEFNFNEFCPHYLTADDSNPTTVPELYQYGWIEFCVEINTDPTHFTSVSLQPTNPTTNFGVNHIYSIEHYIDNCVPNPNNKVDCLRPIYTSIINASCNCDCPSKTLIKPNKG
ncbi:MAG: hypothetical protein WBO44_01825 [Saprospiraceae bacterium]